MNEACSSYQRDRRGSRRAIEADDEHVSAMQGLPLVDHI